MQPSLAGWWLGCVSLPMFQFLLLRWYFRLFIWARFLWQVSRIELSLMPMHPDRCGGLSFLAMVSQAFAPVLVAQGVVLAGMMANRIFFAGAKLPEFKLEIIGLVAVMVFAILGPMLVFRPTSPPPGARACANTASSRSVTRGSSTTSGCAAARRRMSRSSAARTSSRWPILVIATRW